MKHSLKFTITNTLFDVFMTTEGDMSNTIRLMNSVLKYNGLAFKQPCEIDTDIFLSDVSDMESSFYYELNSDFYNDMQHFSVLLDVFIDWTPVIARQNQLMLNGNQVIAISSPSKAA